MDFTEGGAFLWIFFFGVFNVLHADRKNIRQIKTLSNFTVIFTLEIV